MEPLDFVMRALDQKKRTAPNGEDYWMGRDIQAILGYTEWRNFESVIKKAKMACDGSGVQSSYHFVETNKLILVAKRIASERIATCISGIGEARCCLGRCRRDGDDTATHTGRTDRSDNGGDDSVRRQDGLSAYAQDRADCLHGRFGHAILGCGPTLVRRHAEGDPGPRPSEVRGELERRLRTHVGADPNHAAAGRARTAAGLRASHRWHERHPARRGPGSDTGEPGGDRAGRAQLWRVSVLGNHPAVGPRF